MSNGNEEIVDFVEELLKKPHGPPNSIQFEVDTDGDVHGLFEVLLLTMTEILKTWYAPPITLSLISEEDLARLIGYFASFGITFDLTVEDIPPVLHINNKEYLRKDRLEEMRFRMSAGDKLYTVRFSNLESK
jgi:hypothetical protein